MSSEIVKMRTEITEENKVILEEMFNNGMNNKSKLKLALHQQAAVRTGLNVNVVKDWVGNHAKKINGRQHRYPKAVYSRGMTGYNVFVKEKKDDLGSMDTWSKAWNDLDESQKEAYKEQAKETRGAIGDEKRAKKQLLSEVHIKLISLKNLGVDMACVGIDENGKQLLIGEGRVYEYIKETPKVFDEMYSCLAVAVDEKRPNVSIKTLRKQAQNHMNQLYNAATGCEKGFPYHDVKTGVVQISGLPASILPLQHISHYGEPKLKDILSVEKIEVLRSTTAATQPTTSFSSHVIESVSHELMNSQSELQLTDTSTALMTLVPASSTTVPLLQPSIIHLPSTHTTHKSTVTQVDIINTASNIHLTSQTSLSPKLCTRKNVHPLSSTRTDLHCLPGRPFASHTVSNSPFTMFTVSHPTSSTQTIASLPPATSTVKLPLPMADEISLADVVHSISHPQTATQTSTKPLATQPPTTTEICIMTLPIVEASIQYPPITQISTFCPTSMDISDCTSSASDPPLSVNTKSPNPSHEVIHLQHAVQTSNQPQHCPPYTHSVNYSAHKIEATNLIPPISQKTLCKNHLVTDTTKQESDQLHDENNITDQTDHDIFIVEKLLKERKQGRKRQYLVQWLGYNEPTWENASNISDDLIKDFKKEKKTLKKQKH